METAPKEPSLFLFSIPELPRVVFQFRPVLPVSAPARNVIALMKMLFFSSDDMEVEEVSREFSQAGIPCEVRTTANHIDDIPTQSELWVRNDRDCHRALMLCVQRNIGFAKRPEAAPELDTDYAFEDRWC
jgi:hypothetical protein